MDRWMDRWTGGQMDRHRQADGRVDGWMDGRKDGRMMVDWRRGGRMNKLNKQCLAVQGPCLPSSKWRQKWPCPCFKLRPLGGPSGGPARSGVGAPVAWSPWGQSGGCSPAPCSARLYFPRQIAVGMGTSHVIR